MSTRDRTETTSEQPPADRTPVQHYEIRVSGHLGERWATWFDGLSLTSEDDGTTAIRGPVVDQAALHGLIEKLRDLGIPLVSLTRLAADAAVQRPPLPDHQTLHHTPGAPS